MVAKVWSSIMDASLKYFPFKLFRSVSDLLFFKYEIEMTINENRFFFILHSNITL